MARPSLITPETKEWVEQGEAGSATHLSDAPFAVTALELESHNLLRTYLGTWATIGFSLGGFALMAGLNSGDGNPAARNALVVAGLVLLLACGAGGLAVFRAGRRVNRALLWWAEQDDLVAGFSWARLWRNEGPLFFVLGPVVVVATLLGWIFTAATAGSGELVLVPFGLAVAVAFNVATVGVVLHALRRAKVVRPTLPDEDDHPVGP